MGCGGPEARIDLDSPAALAALPDCGPVPEGIDADVDGLVVPPGTLLTDVTANGPITTISGYTPLTPIAIRQHYEQQSDLEVLVIEDEVFEAEALVSDGSHRTYVKANAVCADGSRLLAIVAPELEGDLLPVPDGVPDGPSGG
ncbi:hypothetical protein BH23ACT9_BH23ACT9_09440 [soil metagenome]